MPRALVLRERTEATMTRRSAKQRWKQCIRPADPVLFNDVLTTQSSRREARDADDETSVDGRVGDARGRMAA